MGLPGIRCGERLPEVSELTLSKREQCQRFPIRGHIPDQTRGVAVHRHESVAVRCEVQGRDTSRVSEKAVVAVRSIQVPKIDMSRLSLAGYQVTASLRQSARVAPRGQQPAIPAEGERRDKLRRREDTAQLSANDLLHF